jgi:hypothetical protein
MAWTVSVVRKDVVGSSRQFILSCTADSAEQNVDTGLSYIYGFSMGFTSCTTGGVHVQYNKNSTSTANNGYLGASGFTSGDTILFTVTGR